MGGLSLEVWIVVAVTALAAAIRFSTIGLQAYHHDEAVTVVNILHYGHAGLRKVLHGVRHFESTPPLYYCVVWVWAKVFGVHEAGLRSLSALVGVAVVPVAWLIGKEAVDRRVGLVLATFVAINPWLIWYSQEARAYSMLILLSALSFLFFLRASRTRSKPDFAWWAVASSLALMTHYFALFPIAIEAGLLLRDQRQRRRALWATAPIALTLLALIPLIHVQASKAKHTNWIAHSSVVFRLWETALGAVIGETGRFIGEKPAWPYALVPLALVAAGLVLWQRRSDGERRGDVAGLVVGGGSAAIVVALALVGQDYLLDRNLLPVLIPVLIAVAAGFCATRAGALGIGLAAALCVYWLAFDIYVNFKPELQRPDWRTAAKKIGPPTGPRAVVTWKLAGFPMLIYMHPPPDLLSKKAPPQTVEEIDVIFKHDTPPVVNSHIPSFRQVERVKFGDLTLVRFRAPRPVTVSKMRLEHFRTGFPHNGLFVQDVRSPPVG